MTKQQQRERAERRRKLEEFWRWVLSEKPDVIRIEKAGHDLIPELCNRAIAIARDELYASNQRTGTELHRDLSLAQLDVLEMLEERVSDVSHDEPAMRTGEHADDPKVIVFKPGTRVIFDPRKDQFFHQEVDEHKHPWEFK